MKTSLTLAVALTCLSTLASGQRILPEYDSLPVVSTGFFKDTYNLNNPLLGEVEVVLYSTEPAEKIGRAPRSFSDGMITMLTGIGTSSSQEALFISKSKLKSKNPDQTWLVNLYTKGILEKDRHRVKNPDGSKSVETQKQIILDWPSGSYGVLIEKADTIGSFEVIPDFHADSVGEKWVPRLNAESEWVYTIVKKYNGPYARMNSGANLRVSGILRGREFTFVFSSSNLRTVMLSEGDPRSVFQRPPNFKIIKKSDRIHPHMLFAKTVSEEEKPDLLRLAMLSCLLSRAVSPGAN